MKKAKWQDLRFGVEVEFTGIPISRASLLLAKLLQTKAVHTGGDNDRYEITEPNSNRTWCIVRDSSIRPYRLNEKDKRVPANRTYRCELVTPILSYNSHDITTLSEIVQLIKEAGGIVNQKCAVHVHVSAEAFDAKQLRILCNLVFSKQELLRRALKIEPKRLDYCKPLPEIFIRRLNKQKPKTLKEFGEIWFDGPATSENRWRDRYHSSRYRFINLSNLLAGRQKTVEYRCYNGSLDFAVITAYILLSLVITAKALNQTKASWTETISNNPKFSLRVFLLKLGCIGSEFKDLRNYLLSNLTGNATCRGNKDEKNPVWFSPPPENFPTLTIPYEEIWPDEEHFPQDE